MQPQIFDLLRTIPPTIGVIVLVSVGGWVLTTWPRIKYGHPLHTPGRPEQRMRVLERVVTDKGLALAEQIERLREDRPSHGGSR